MTIKLPARVSDSFGDPLKWVTETLAAIYNSTDDHITVDCTNCRFVTPFILGSLAALISHLRLAGKQVTINASSNSYFDTICFPDGIALDVHQPELVEQSLEKFHRKNYLPVVSFPTGSDSASNMLREKIISAVNSILRRQLNLQGNMLEGIYYLIDELTQNVTDHSRAASGFIVAQHYPAKNFMDICIADCGRGVRQSYLDTGIFTPANDEESIESAISGKSTKPGPDSRGFGIPTSKRMLIEGLRGRFFLWSGAAWTYQDIERKDLISVPQEHCWQGCMVALRVPTFNNTQFSIYNFVG